MQSTDIDIDLDLARIAEAAEVIAPVFLGSPQYVDEQLCAALGKRVLVKAETLNPLRSFKGRGVDFLARDFDQGTRLVCESTGNFGQAIAYAAGRRGLRAEIFVPRGISPVKLIRMASLGARVHEIDAGEAEAAARAYAAEHADAAFIEDGLHPAISEGAGTIGVELLRSDGIDTVVLPVGDGALITGVARWIKAHAPRTWIVGVCAEGAASMARSWRAGHVVATGQADTVAEGIAIRSPIPESVARMRALVDDIVLVDDKAMLAAMRTAASTLGLLLEPAGAAGLAAIAEHDLPGETMATVLTGANVSPGLFGEL